MDNYFVFMVEIIMESSGDMVFWDTAEYDIHTVFSSFQEIHPDGKRW